RVKTVVPLQKLQWRVGEHAIPHPPDGQSRTLARLRCLLTLTGACRSHRNRSLRGLADDRDRLQSDVAAVAALAALQHALRTHNVALRKGEELLVDQRICGLHGTG